MYLNKRDDRIYIRGLSLSDSAEAFGRFLAVFPDISPSMVNRILRDAKIGKFFSAKYGDPETANAEWNPVIARLESMQTRSNRRRRRSRGNRLRLVPFSDG
jgi:hypothetical protein